MKKGDLVRAVDKRVSGFLTDSKATAFFISHDDVLVYIGDVYTSKKRGITDDTFKSVFCPRNGLVYVNQSLLRSWFRQDP